MRAFAVAAVIFHHYRRGGWDYGAYTGVKLFFTISGFLITGILLRSRDEAKAMNLNRLRAMARFYARRCLRIFPLYYFIVAVTLAIDLEPARKLVGWLLTYTLNIHMAHQGWFEDNFAHFWSLSVEEQFYICWPWLMLFLPRKGLIPAAIIMVLTGPIYRLSYILSGYQNMKPISTYISTLSCVDSLGAGALLAMVVHFGILDETGLRRLRRILVPVGIAAVGALIFWGRKDVYLVAHDASQAVVFCGLISAVSTGLGGGLGVILRWKPLLYIGKISYGLYVYHPFMPDLSVKIMTALGFVAKENSLPVSIFATIFTLAAASLSWHLMEKPINNFKRRF